MHISQETTPATPLTQVGRIVFTGNTETKYSVYPANYGVVRALCGSVTEAAKRWRQTIQEAEERGDGEAEAVARRAHAYLCLTLMGKRALPHQDLAALIDTTQTPTTSGGQFAIIISEDFRISPIDTVGKLIDYSATRMSAAL